MSEQEDRPLPSGRLLAKSDDDDDNFEVFSLVSIVIVLVLVLKLSKLHYLSSLVITFGMWMMVKF